MRGLVLNICFAAATVFIFSAAAYSQGQGYSETDLQRSFAEEVKSLPDIIQATWQSPLDLWVYADGVNQATAQAVADKVVILAQTDFGQSLCVHVHDGDFNPLATKCWSSL
ncbi:MAG TPA: hypothetical protein VHC46_08010 [Thermodesulfobacteriota bacterium]|nr:hypothetical protein [Thermodesulfobacteriota bacterium]